MPKDDYSNQAGSNYWRSSDVLRSGGPITFVTKALENFIGLGSVVQGSLWIHHRFHWLP